MSKKYFANKGVKRNKKPLQNIIYKVEEIKSDYILSWQYEKDYNKFNIFNWHGPITSEELKILLGQEQWGKFTQGKRRFISQRRINGKNI